MDRLWWEAKCLLMYVHMCVCPKLCAPSTLTILCFCLNLPQMISLYVDMIVKEGMFQGVVS